MQHIAKRASAVLTLFLIPATILCPCVAASAPDNAPGETPAATGKSHCARGGAGPVQPSYPVGPCGSETCHHCPTDLAGVAYASAAGSLGLTSLPVDGGICLMPLPALSVARAGSVAGDHSPPGLSRPILELNCCFLI